MPVKYPYFRPTFQANDLIPLINFFIEKTNMFFEGFIKVYLSGYPVPFPIYTFPFTGYIDGFLPFFIPPIGNNSVVYNSLTKFYMDVGNFPVYEGFISGDVVRIDASDDFDWSFTYAFYKSGQSPEGIDTGRSFSLSAGKYFIGSYYSIAKLSVEIYDLQENKVKPFWACISSDANKDLDLISNFLSIEMTSFQNLLPALVKREGGATFEYCDGYRGGRVLFFSHFDPQVYVKRTVIYTYVYVPKVVIFLESSSNATIYLNAYLSFNNLPTYLKGIFDSLFNELFGLGLTSYNEDNYGSVWELRNMTYAMHSAVWGFRKDISAGHPVNSGLPVWV